ncbi:MAG: hypothetical protein ACNYPD_06845 [Candidatus Halichondribacter symbioticus]
MDNLTTIIVSTIAGLAVLAIAGICKRLFSRKKPESNSQTTTIKGDNNKVTNIIKERKRD